MNREHTCRPILVTGLPRSGTSLTAGILHLCGAWGGELVGPSKHNPKGMFENNEIRNRTIKPYFRRMGADPLGQRGFPDIYRLAAYPDLRGDVLEIVRRQGYVSGPWFYKEPKMLLVWPEWAEAFPSARWVVVRRDPEDVVSSCMRTAFMRAYQTRDGWREWVGRQLEIIRDLSAGKRFSGLNFREVWPEKVIGGDLTEIRSVVEWAELAWNEPAVRDFMDKELWHGKAGGGSGRSGRRQTGEHA